MRLDLASLFRGREDGGREKRRNRRECSPLGSLSSRLCVLGLKEAQVKTSGTEITNP